MQQFNDEYSIEITIRHGPKEPWHFRMQTSMPSAVVPVHHQRAHFEHVCREVLQAATDKLFEGKA